MNAAHNNNHNSHTHVKKRPRFLVSSAGTSSLQTKIKNTGGATSNPKLPNTQKLLLFSSLLVSKANPPKKTNLIRNKTKDKSLQQVQQLDHLQQQQQQQIKLLLLLLLSFLSSAWFLSPTKNTPPQKRTKLAAASTDSYRWINKIFATDFFLSFFLSCLLAFLLLSCY
jgi:hypothetical protein